MRGGGCDTGALVLVDAMDAPIDVRRPDSPVAGRLEVVCSREADPGDDDVDPIENASSWPFNRGSWPAFPAGDLCFDASG